MVSHVIHDGVRDEASITLSRSPSSAVGFLNRPTPAVTSPSHAGVTKVGSVPICASLGSDQFECCCIRFPSTRASRQVHMAGCLSSSYSWPSSRPRIFDPGGMLYARPGWYDCRITKVIRGRIHPELPTDDRLGTGACQTLNILVSAPCLSSLVDACLALSCVHQLFASSVGGVFPMHKLRLPREYN